MIYGTIDGVFRSILDAGWFSKANGSVSFPVGYYSIVEIPEIAKERAEMRESVFSDDPIEAEVFDTVEAGWYFVVQKEDGTITFRQCSSARDAFTLYEHSEEAFSAWVTPDE